MWWSADASDLGRITSRVSTLYLDRCALDRTQNSITVGLGDKTIRIPAAMIGALLLGPGTTVTHGAMNLLANSGTSVCWVGDGGVRFYAGGTATSSSGQVAIRQAELVSNRERRLQVARAMYGMRFAGEQVDDLDMQQLLGREGARVRKLYLENSRRTGVEWTGRDYIPGKAMAAGDDVNRLLSAANTALYGLCHAVVVSVGAIPSLGFVHTGSANSFVLDIADLYKHETTIPLAFDLAKAEMFDERDARLAFRESIVSSNLLSRAANDVFSLLGIRTDAPEISGHIWNGSREIAGGQNHYSEAGELP